MHTGNYNVKFKVQTWFLYEVLLVRVNSFWVASNSWILSLDPKPFLLIVMVKSFMNCAHYVDELCTLCWKSFEIKILKIEIISSNIELCTLYWWVVCTRLKVIEIKILKTKITSSNVQLCALCWWVMHTMLKVIWIQNFEDWNYKFQHRIVHTMLMSCVHCVESHLKSKF